VTRDSGSVTRLMYDAYAMRSRGEDKRPSDGWASLTPSERAVADLVADGLTNAEIAAQLSMTTAAAKIHLHHVFVKVGVTTRYQLAAAVLECPSPERHS
jgi:DNA-binding CsgD family transcriptional regulator